MGGTGTYIVDAALVHPNHASSCNAQHPHIQGTDIGVMSADLGIVNARTAILDNADVGGGTAHLKIDGVGSTQVHKGTHDRSSRS